MIKELPKIPNPRDLFKNRSQTLGNLMRLSKHTHIMPFLKNTTKGIYFKTYAAYGVTLVLLTTFFCEWRRVGKKIPGWTEFRSADYYYPKHWTSEPKTGK